MLCRRNKFLDPPRKSFPVAASSNAIVTVNTLQQLRTHVDALSVAVEQHPGFFGPILHYLRQLKQAIAFPQGAQTIQEIDLLVAQLEEFWARYRPTRDSGMYIPPREVSATD